MITKFYHSSTNNLPFLFCPNYKIENVLWILYMYVPSGPATIMHQNFASSIVATLIVKLAKISIPTVLKWRWPARLNCSWARWWTWWSWEPKGPPNLPSPQRWEDILNILHCKFFTISTDFNKKKHFWLHSSQKKTLFLKIRFWQLFLAIKVVSWKNQSNFCDQCNHSFNLKCFYQIPLTWTYSVTKKQTNILTYKFLGHANRYHAGHLFPIRLDGFCEAQIHQETNSFCNEKYF